LKISCVNGKRPLSLLHIISFAPWIPAGPVLDLGAGQGQLALRLARYGFAVTAVERDPAAIHLWDHAHPDLHAWQADLRDLELQTEHWAAIVCLNLFPFLPCAEHTHELARIANALRPGGLLIFSAFSPEDPSAGGWLASDRQGQRAPTGVLTRATLEQAFPDWECCFYFQGAVHDDHPPYGPHTHHLIQVVLRKPRPERTTVWSALPRLGAGLGWRPELDALLQQPDVADFIEIMSDDFLDPAWDHVLLNLSRRYAVIPHGVELSPGSGDQPDTHYLDHIQRITARCDSPWWSDHVCYTRTPEVRTWSLNPLPCHEEALEQLCRQARAAQTQVGRPLLLENPAYYWRPDLPGQMSDAEFLCRLSESADCGLLLDLANLYGNAHNLGIDPYALIDALPAERVVQVHLAGGQHDQGLIFDTHDQAVETDTWNLLAYTLRRCDVKAISLERDSAYTELRALVREVSRARQGMRL
jgi:uncharacterized protein (UPF0276 family)